MPKKDGEGHIIGLDSLAESVPFPAGACRCTNCGKDAPRIWDTICYYCFAVTCYDCATVVDGKWVCPRCLDARPWRAR